MKRVLIVQSEHCLYQVLVSQITAVTGMPVDVVDSLELAEECIKHLDYLVMLLDVDLSGTKDKEIESFIAKNSLPVIMMADRVHADLKVHFQGSLVVDYVVKESPEVITHIVKSVNRIFKNQFTKVLVVDDSGSDRKLISMIAKNQLYQVCEARNGQEALALLENDPSIKIIVADIHMPRMDGIALLKYIREKKLQNELAILGVSSDQESLIRFIKLGANDFVAKPFSKREFTARLNHLADVYEQIKELDELSNRDYLTGLRSRKFFYEEATPYVYGAYKSGEPCAVAMIDIDNFKNINDTYGHAAGDVVLKGLAKLLHDSLKGRDIVARYGGEEFCVLLRDTKKEDAVIVFERLREEIAKELMHVVAIPRGLKISVTVSIGVNTQVDAALTKMLQRADYLLYEAKKNGKNQIATQEILELEEVV